MPCEDRPITGLLPDQQRAADHRGGHARLLAGPGTGKTRTLVELVSSLIRDGSLPGEILCLTFTRAAAAGLRRKIRERLGSEDVPEVSTLHGFALKQLMAQNADIGAGRGRARVADDWEERHVIEEDLKAPLSETDVRGVRRRLAALAAAWETDPEPGIEERHGDPELIGALRQHKTQYRYVLRSELVFRLKERLDADPYFPLTGTFQYVVVDEYQDLNRCDVAVINAIALQGASLFVAGDDDQSIYQQLRNAHPQSIRDFVTNHGAADLRLTICVRSDSGIIDLATDVIRQEVGRTPKTLGPHESAGPGIVESIAFLNAYQEARGIAALVKHFADAGIEKHEILVLLRSDFRGAFSGPIKAALDALAVPSRVRTGDKSALDLDDGRSLLALLRLSIDPVDDLAWRTAFATGRLGAGAGAIAAIHSYEAARPGVPFSGAIAAAEADPTVMERGPAIAGAARRVRERLAALAAAAPLDATPVAALIDAAASLLTPGPDLADAVSELQGLVTLWAPASISDFLGGLALRKEEEEDVVRNTVNIMTAHKAKGLDACVVILAAAEEELFPGRGDIDEERRLFYVSLTRAKHALYISHARGRAGQQARAGTGGTTHERTRFLEGTGLVARPGIAFLRTYDPDLTLLSPRRPD